MHALTLLKPCPSCKKTLEIQNEIVTCQSCDYKISYTCPICNHKLTPTHFIPKKNTITCDKCNTPTPLTKIQSILNNGLKIDYQKTCPYCKSPTLHRHDMNIGHRCFHYPNCNGQTSLFQDKKEAFVFLDFETTGLEVIKEEIIEIGAYKIDDEGIESFYQTLVKPTKEISQTITDITTITNEMVTSSPEISSTLPTLLSFIGNATLVVHNAEFDILWLLHQAEKQNIPIQPLSIICTLQWAKTLEEKTLSLERLARKYHIQHKNAHRALADAASTRDLFFIFLEQKKLPYTKQSLSH